MPTHLPRPRLNASMFPNTVACSPTQGEVAPACGHNCGAFLAKVSAASAPWSPHLCASRLDPLMWTRFAGRLEGPSGLASQRERRDFAPLQKTPRNAKTRARRSPPTVANVFVDLVVLWHPHPRVRLPTLRVRLQPLTARCPPIRYARKSASQGTGTLAVATSLTTPRVISEIGLTTWRHAPEKLVTPRNGPMQESLALA